MTGNGSKKCCTPVRSAVLVCVCARVCGPKHKAIEISMHFKTMPPTHTHSRGTKLSKTKLQMLTKNGKWKWGEKAKSKYQKRNINSKPLKSCWLLWAEHNACKAEELKRSLCRAYWMVIDLPRPLKLLWFMESPTTRRSMLQLLR